MQQQIFLHLLATGFFFWSFRLVLDFWLCWCTGLILSGSSYNMFTFLNSPLVFLPCSMKKQTARAKKRTRAAYLGPIQGEARRRKESARQNPRIYVTLGSLGCDPHHPCLCMRTSQSFLHFPSHSLGQSGSASATVL